MTSTQIDMVNNGYTLVCPLDLPSKLVFLCCTVTYIYGLKIIRCSFVYMLSLFIDSHYSG